MNLPADLSEGWWRVVWADGETTIQRMIERNGEIWFNRPTKRPVAMALHYITAMERVAPPSWEKTE